METKVWGMTLWILAVPCWSEPAKLSLVVGQAHTLDLGTAVKDQIRFEVTRRGVVDLLEFEPGHWLVTGLRPGVVVIKGLRDESLEKSWIVQVVRKEHRPEPPKRPPTRPTVAVPPSAVEPLQLKLAGKILLVSEEHRRQTGLKWFEAGIGEVPLTSEGKAISSLTALDSEDRVQVLGEPQVLFRTGHWAGFHTGSEQRYQARDDTYRSPWKKIGLGFRFLATKLSGDRVSLRYELGLSHPGKAEGQISAHSVDSEVTLPMGETVMVSVIDLDFEGAGRDGFTLLESLPILGPLFSHEASKFANHRLLLTLRVSREALSTTNSAKPPD